MFYWSSIQLQLPPLRLYNNLIVFSSWPKRVINIDFKDRRRCFFGQIPPGQPWGPLKVWSLGAVEMRKYVYSDVVFKYSVDCQPMIFEEICLFGLDFFWSSYCILWLLSVFFKFSLELLSFYKKIHSSFIYIINTLI